MNSPPAAHPAASRQAAGVTPSPSSQGMLGGAAGPWTAATILQSSPLLTCALVPLLSLVAWYVASYVASPLRKYPGPRLAAWTNWWRLYHARSGNMHVVAKRLHDRYGPVVRTAPNQLDVDYPSLIKTCFDNKGVWRKTEMYGVSGVLVDGKVEYNIFSTMDSPEHTRMKKPIAKFYSMNGVLPFQQLVDSVLAYFTRQLNERFAGAPDGAFGPAFDFGDWLAFYTWDAMAKATFGSRVGYLDRGADFDGTINLAETTMSYLVVVGMQPALDKLMDKNPIHRVGPPAFKSLVDIALKRLLSRYDGSDKHDPAKPDFLDRFIESKKECPDIVDDRQILSYLLMNISAGSDTTAATLRSVFYLTLKHPAVWARLQAEILAAPFAQADATDLPAPFSQARALPYLEAVVREALRLFPGNCMAMERYVPAGGVHLPDGPDDDAKGSFVPPGVSLGFNAYVVHRNRSVWGDDADAFRPERWLRDAAESEDAFAARLQAMNNCDLSFGAGKRKCIGMNMGMMEVYKTVATLTALYEFELADPAAEWTIHNCIFPIQSGVVVRMRRRRGMEVKGDVGLDE